MHLIKRSAHGMHLSEDLSVQEVSSSHRQAIQRRKERFSFYVVIITLMLAPLTTLGQASVATSIVKASFYTIPTGGTTVITVQLKDANGANITNGTETVSFATPSAGSMGAVTNNGNGTYSATYTAGVSTGSITITPRLGVSPVNFINSLTITVGSQYVLDGTSGNSVRSDIISTTGNLVLSQAFVADYLIVAGGGGGGGDNGGGGGAVGMLAGIKEITATSHAVTVGAGGAGGAINVAGTSGGSSSVFSLTATGGGGGSGGDASAPAKTGGSGGGGNGETNSSGASGTIGQGNAGGTGSSGAGGGGGGAGAAGANGSSVVNLRGGNGGAGKSTFISGPTIAFYAGGGGGGPDNNTNSSSSGGIGGGGAGKLNTGDNGSANTGGGGGGAGAGTTGNGGSGGSGIVIIRYPGSEITGAGEMFN